MIHASLEDTPILKVFAEPSHAICDTCELTPRCLGQHGRPVIGEGPEDWEEGGLMIIAEAPSRSDALYGRPLTGNEGRLVEDALRGAGLARDRCWITHAVLGYPDPALGDAKAKGELFSKRFPHAVQSCRPRLFAEIEAARPRVIVTLGRAALHALLGKEYKRRRQVTNVCQNVRCDDAWGRKIGPVLACHRGTCDWHAVAPADVFEAGWPDVVKAKEQKVKGFRPEAWLEWGEETLAELRDAKGTPRCPKCEAKLRNLPRLVKCPTCGGTKTKVIEDTLLSDEYPLVGREGAAGAVFKGEECGLAQYGVRYVIPTYSPGFCTYSVNTSGAKKKAIGGQFAARVLLEHLMKARRLLTSESQWRDPEVIAVHPGDPEGLAKIREYLSRPGRYAADIETDSFDGPFAVRRISCIGFARADDSRALVIDTRRVYPLPPPATDTPENKMKWRAMTADEAAWADDVLDILEEFFGRSDVGVVWHNGIYDRIVMQRLWDLWTYNTVGDTQAAHTVCYPDEEHGLGFVAHELLDAPLWKGDDHRRPNKGTTDELSGYSTFQALALYNARDNLATALVDEVLVGPPGGRGRVHAEGVERALEDDLFNYDLGVRMTMAGIPICRKTQKELGATFRKEIDELLSEMRHTVGRQNWSPRGDDEIWAFFDPAGPCRFPVAKRGKNGKPSVAKDILKPFYGQHPLVAQVLRYRTLTYYLSHFVESDGIRIDNDGRLRPVWSPRLVTGRWACEPNIHAWPKGSDDKPELNMRRMVVAPPGRRIVGIDYSQLELRIMAALSNDAALIALIANADESDKLNPDKDPHSYLARAVFGATYVDADKGTRKKLRDCVKRVWYGSLYGAGGATITASILDSDYSGPPLSVPFVEGVLQMIAKEFPGTQRWRDEQIRLLRRTREVVAPASGRHRVFPLGEAEITIALNFPIQCLNPDTRVVWDGAYQKIGDVFKRTKGRKVGEAALGEGIRATHAPAAVLAKGEEQVWVTRLDDGRELKTNAGHKFRVLLPTGDFGWREVSDLRPGDQLADVLLPPVTLGAPSTSLPWLVGYWIGNGSWVARMRRSGEVGFHCGSRVGGGSHADYAQKILALFRELDIQHQKPRVNGELTSIVSTSLRLQYLLTCYGIDPAWRAHTKRVPEGIWGASLQARADFLRGLFEADGARHAFDNAQPALNMCNRELLLDVQLLARTLGIPSKLRGPYRADREGHVAWRLDFAESLLRRALWGDATNRQVYGRNGGVAESVRAAALDVLRGGALATASHQTLLSRLQKANTIHPLTLRDMLLAAGEVLPAEFYGTQRVVSVGQTEEVSPMFTLMVDHPMHQYDSEGLISKNSTAADLVNWRVRELDAVLPEVDETATCIIQHHDAVYIECAEEHVEAVKRLSEDVLRISWQIPGTDHPMFYDASADDGQSWDQA